MSPGSSFRVTHRPGDAFKGKGRGTDEDNVRRGDNRRANCPRKILRDVFKCFFVSL